MLEQELDESSSTSDTTREIDGHGTIWVICLIVIGGALSFSLLFYVGARGRRRLQVYCIPNTNVKEEQAGSKEQQELPSSLRFMESNKRSASIGFLDDEVQNQQEKQKSGHNSLLLLTENSQSKHSLLNDVDDAHRPFDHTIREFYFDGDHPKVSIHCDGSSEKDEDERSLSMTLDEEQGWNNKSSSDFTIESFPSLVSMNVIQDKRERLGLMDLDRNDNSHNTLEEDVGELLLVDTAMLVHDKNGEDDDDFQYYGVDDDNRHVQRVDDESHPQPVVQSSQKHYTVNEDDVKAMTEEIKTSAASGHQRCYKGAGRSCHLDDGKMLLVDTALMAQQPMNDDTSTKKTNDPRRDGAKACKQQTVLRPFFQNDDYMLDVCGGSRVSTLGTGDGEDSIFHTSVFSDEDFHE